jgi:hypothetical protein
MIAPLDGLYSDNPLAYIKELLGAATPGPWWIEDDEDTWVLQGVAARFDTPPLGETVVNSQILKAPKHGTDYAEYWPSAADGELISRSREIIDWLVVELERVQGAAAPTES